MLAGLYLLIQTLRVYSLHAIFTIFAVFTAGFFKLDCSIILYYQSAMRHTVARIKLLQFINQKERSAVLLVPQTKSPISCAHSFPYLYQIEIQQIYLNNAFENMALTSIPPGYLHKKSNCVIVVAGQNNCFLAFFSDKGLGCPLKFVQKLHQTPFENELSRPQFDTSIVWNFFN